MLAWPLSSQGDGPTRILWRLFNKTLDRWGSLLNPAARRDSREILVCRTHSGPPQTFDQRKASSLHTKLQGFLDLFHPHTHWTALPDGDHVEKAPQNSEGAKPNPRGPRVPNAQIGTSLFRVNNPEQKLRRDPEPAGPSDARGVLRIGYLLRTAGRWRPLPMRDMTRFRFELFFVGPPHVPRPLRVDQECNIGTASRRNAQPWERSECGGAGPFHSPESFSPIFPQAGLGERDGFLLTLAFE